MNTCNKQTLKLRMIGLCLLACGMVLFISACTTSPTTTLAPITQIPASVDTPVPSSTAIPSPTVVPLPTTTPSATIVPTGACFVTYQDPFAFLPGTLQMLVRASEGVQIYDLHTMQEVKFLQAPSSLNDPVVALSPDGQKLAWALEDGTVQVVRIADQSVLASFSSEQVAPVKLEYSPTGETLYSVSHDGSVKSWDQAGTLLNALLPGFELVNIGISPDGQLLATIPFDGPVRLWKTSDFKWFRDLGGTGGYDTSDVAFSPDGQYLAADLATGLFVWSIPDAKEFLGSITPTNSLAAAYSPDGSYLAYGDPNNVIISSPDGLQLIRTLSGHQAPVFDLVFSPDSSLLVSADGQEIRVWRLADGQLLAIGKSACP